ncbi:hypothetical protein JVU11DRAFT_3750 [Chiua virens]|nr:hypothetical protein JVU11DRAFT_3750 [Chiua virens]
MSEHSAFDIIFAGGEFDSSPTITHWSAGPTSGGTTACVVAGRLAAADPSLKILIIESGQHSNDVPIHVQPCRSVQNLVPDSATVSFHAGKASIHLNGRVPVVPCGRSVGGGSTVNFMLYVRGAASDYDDWATFGNEGWSFSEVLPFFKKFETFAPISNRLTHGYSGPIGISTVKAAEIEIGSQLLDVGKMYDPDRPYVDDCNDFKTSDAYSPAHLYIDPATGKRCDAASRYLYPYSDNPNLRVLVDKSVKRVILKNGRAVGVEYSADTRSSPGSSDDFITIMASKTERSGIGAPSVLEKNKVDVLIDLPGVGERYQDHCGALPVYHVSDETETMDDVWSNPEAITAYLNEWKVNGTGKITHNGIEAIMKVRPTAAQLASERVCVAKEMGNILSTQSRQSYGSHRNSIWIPSRSLRNQREQIYLCGLLHLVEFYPELLGSVHITSGEDANAPLDFDPDFCSKPGDIAQLNLFYKMARERARRMPTYRGEVTALHPQFPAGSPAACKESDLPVAMDAPDIVYSEADDEAIAKYHRDVVLSIWHSLGTCAMKPRDQGGVVDARLNVYGVQGLKVADLSICPTNVGNNTYSTALMIGEKVATIIAEDLGLKFE